jgi:hypothetical protein
MADYFGAATDLLGGASSLVSGFASSAGSKAAAKYFGEAADYAQLGGELKNRMIQRQAYQTIGQEQAATAGNGFQMEGSSADIMRSSAQQAGIARGINTINTDIQVQGYNAQAASAKAAASAQSSGGIMGGIGGIIGAAASIFSDDNLKKNISLVRMRADGLGVYEFEYENIEGRFRGVLASEVERQYPRAVSMNKGWRQIDYKAINAEFRRVA